MRLKAFASTEARKGESVNRKPTWTGIAPTPRIFEQLDQEEISVLALLAWASATNRPITSAEIAALPDRNGNRLGLQEAKHITKTLANMKVVSVLGMNNDFPLSVFLGGFQPRSASRFNDTRSPRTLPPGARGATARPAAPGQTAHRQPARSPFREPGQVPAPVQAAPRLKLTRKQLGDGPVIENKTNELPKLRATNKTPDFVPREAGRLRAAQVRMESGEFGDDLVAAARERLRILEERIALYQRWLKEEPDHPALPAFLERKRKALPELRRQIEVHQKGSNRSLKRAAEGKQSA